MFGVATLLAIAVFVVPAPELVLAAANGCVSPGNDGPNPALTGIVNTYYPATASAAAGATTISVGARIPGGSPDIAAGDLLLVIQMQDADISDTNTVAYGDGATGRGYTAVNSTGKYEYVRAVSAVVAGAVAIAGSGAGSGLVNGYDFSTTVSAVAPIHGFRTFQVIRVPQYSSATLAAGLTAAAWDGTIHAGGVLAVDVAGALNFNGQSIGVNQLGFKGALGAPQAGPANGATGTDYVVPSLHGQHGYKGEGIAGTPRFLYDPIAGAAVNGAADGYPNGDAARGAPGNSGGGGTDADPAINDQNSGGGGGGNGGQGGGGGNSWSSNLPLGGLGGAEFPAAATRVVLGGGGGAGTRNNSSGFASSGGTGGGIVMIRAGSAVGTGTITADGGVGVTPLNDGGGGGGAGGSVIVSTATGNVGGLTISANGGGGTDAWPTDTGGVPDYHGPGGGGAGGVIITSSVPLSTSVLGGVHGTTTTDLNAYGSSSGAPGVVLATTPGGLPGSSSGAECLPLLTVTKTTSTPSVTNTAGGTTATYSITVGNAINTAAATGITISDALPAGFSYASTGGIVLNGGSARPTTVDPSPGDTNPAFGTFTIPAGGSVVITFTVNVVSSVPDGTYNNPAAATYLDPTRTTVSGTTSSGYPGGGAERVTVGLPADIAVTKTVSNGAPNQNTNVTFTITAANNGPGTASGVQVTDLLPAGLTLVSATPSAGTTYTPGSGLWNIGALANGAQATLSIVANVKVTTPVTNTAIKTAEDQSDPGAGNNSASATVTALPGLPNTSAPFGTGGSTISQAPLGISLAVFGIVAGMGALGVAAACSPRRRRFRPRRSQGGIRRDRGERLTLGGSALLAGLVLGVVSSGQLGAFAAAQSTASAAVSDAPDTSIAGSPYDNQLVGGPPITTTAPAAAPAESFHLAAGPIVPARLRVPSIGVDARVDGVGLRTDGSMDVPGNLWTSSWLSEGPRPGQPGNAVIAGHRGIGTPGLFGHLESLRADDRIYISDATGGELVFEVTRIASLSLTRATQVEVFGPTPLRQLVLVTCYGKYLASTGSYDHRLVVFSSLVPQGS
ncbi:MAG TPA: sortase [Candidatus Dormibacteraeota bacterium]|nr:sortase [Candidatus Dormibacteraeota bacterium]